MEALADYTGDCPSHVISKQDRAVMQDRGKRIKLTADFGRPYKCIVDSHKSYLLDDWLHFLETCSLYILQADMLDDLVQDVLQKLR